MLQSEFFERTQVNLTGEEYAEVERMYNAVTMDKDTFCKMWLEFKDNQLVKELMAKVEQEEEERKNVESSFKSLVSDMNVLRSENDRQLQEMSDMHKSEMEEFGKKLIKAGEYDFPSDIYDAIEEEFGIGFIIKTKWEQSIELSDEEIQYMVNKL